MIHGFLNSPQEGRFCPVNASCALKGSGVDGKTWANFINTECDMLSEKIDNLKWQFTRLSNICYISFPWNLSLGREGKQKLSRLFCYVMSVLPSYQIFFSHVETFSLRAPLNWDQGSEQLVTVCWDCESLGGYCASGTGNDSTSPKVRTSVFTPTTVPFSTVKVIYFVLLLRREWESFSFAFHRKMISKNSRTNFKRQLKDMTQTLHFQLT